MRKRLVPLGLAAAMVATPAAATDWVMLRELLNTTRIDLIDKDSLRVGDGQAEALLYTIFKDDAPSGMAGLEARYQFDCQRSCGRMVHVRTFHGDGRERTNGPMQEDWSEIAPANFLSVMRTFACSNGAQPRGTSLGGNMTFVQFRQILRDAEAERR